MNLCWDECKNEELWKYSMCSNWRHNLEEHGLTCAVFHLSEGTRSTFVAEGLLGFFLMLEMDRWSSMLMLQVFFNHSK